MGCENFTYPIAKPTPIDGITKSIFFPDACIFPGHSRYKNTTKNIMARRGEKPFYNLQGIFHISTYLPTYKNNYCLLEFHTFKTFLPPYSY